MFSMFRQFFMAFTTLFSALEKVANSLNCLATVGEDMANGYLEETRLERAARIQELTKQLKAVSK